MPAGGGSEGSQTYIVKADDHDRVLVLARQIRVKALEEMIHRVDDGREVAKEVSTQKPTGWSNLSLIGCRSHLYRRRPPRRMIRM